VTAMRYGCLKHTNFDACSADQHSWCTWHDESSSCVLEYANADFVHLLLWSGASIGCQGSKIQQVVLCSYLAASDACKTNAPCTWVEGACYPSTQQWWFSNCSLPCNASRILQTSLATIAASPAGTQCAPAWTNLPQHCQGGTMVGASIRDDGSNMGFCCIVLALQLGMPLWQLNLGHWLHSKSRCAGIMLQDYMRWPCLHMKQSNLSLLGGLYTSACVRRITLYYWDVRCSCPSTVAEGFGGAALASKLCRGPVIPCWACFALAVGAHWPEGCLGQLCRG
jgi:hypothetical protein